MTTKTEYDTLTITRSSAFGSIGGRDLKRLHEGSWSVAYRGRIGGLPPEPTMDQMRELLSYLAGE